MKAEPGKDFIVDGLPSLIHQFIRLGLADDYRMAVWPVIYGRTTTHYGGSTLNQQTLKLLSVKTLPYGKLVLQYETVR